METPEQAPQMNQFDNSKRKALIGALVILALGVLFFGFMKFGKPLLMRGPGVKVERVPVINGVSSLPAGFPSDIPLESFAILEGATTYHPGGQAKQFSVSYLSAKTMAQKHAEYKEYMTSAGYLVTEEGSANSAVRAIFGEKDGNKLSIVLSQSQGETLVQVAYLLIQQF